MTVIKIHENIYKVYRSDDRAGEMPTFNCLLADLIFFYYFPTGQSNE